MSHSVHHTVPSPLFYRAGNVLVPNGLVWVDQTSLVVFSMQNQPFQQLAWCATEKAWYVKYILHYLFSVFKCFNRVRSMWFYSSSPLSEWIHFIVVLFYSTIHAEVIICFISNNFYDNCTQIRPRKLTAFIERLRQVAYYLAIHFSMNLLPKR